jgi:hypothetical protein
MKKLTFGILAVLGLIAHFGPPVLAQSAALRANIPFDFNAGDVKFSVGEYTAHVLNGFVLMLQNQDGRSVTIGTIPFQSDLRSATQGMLVFKRYGDQYFLHRAIWPGYFGRELYRSKLESEIGRNLKGDEVRVTTARK